jgi:sugar lactone lactonase YvrE
VSGDTTMPVRIYVTNGAAVDSRGNVYTMNTGTGTVWRIEMLADHKAGAITKVVESPHLIGADGVVVGAGDTLYATQNFNNTFAKISPTGELTVLVQADAGLHFPAELVRDGNTVYIANLNFPLGANAAGHRPGASIAKVTLP